MKGYTEMTIAELKAEMAELRKQNIYPHNQIMAWQKKYSIPAACLAFMLVALGMGVSHRRDGRLAAFVARHRRGLRLLDSDVHVRSDRARRACCPIGLRGSRCGCRTSSSALWGLRADREEAAGARAVVHAVCRCRSCGAARAPQRRQDGAASPGREARACVVVIKIPHIAFPRPSILDWYVLKQGLRVSVLAAVGTAGAVLHRELHRSVGPPVQGADDGVRCADVSVVGVAAIYLLPGSACGADGRAGDDRRADEEHRAGGDEGVRHQPVSRGRSAADSRDDRQRDSARPRRGRARRTRTGAPTPSTTRFAGGSRRRPI